MDVIVPLIIITFLITLNGIFVAAEFSIVAAPRTRIAQLADDGSSVAKGILKILIDPILQNEYITTAQVGITVASLALGMYGEHVFADWLLNPLISIIGHSESAETLAHTIAIFLSVAVLTYIHVVLGEMIPKSLALQAPQPTVLALGRPMAFLQKILYPVIWSLNHMGNFIVKILGVPEAVRETRLFTSEELEFIVDESSEGGMLEKSDQLFFQNILDLQERTVEQVMTPRNRVIGFPADADSNLIIQTLCHAQKSRYPVYEEDLDKIIGLLHIKDFARHLVSVDTTEVPITKIIRQTIFVPSSLTLDKMLSQFRKSPHQFAIVIDEYGGTAGIITIEDLEEEVVGEILDEFDRETQPIKVLSSGNLRVRGDVLLDELNQLFDLNLEHPEANTIGGLAMALLGRIPVEGDEIHYGDAVIEIEAIEHLAVKSILIKIQNPKLFD